MWSFTHDETKFTGSGLSELMCLWPCRSITTFVSETSNLKQLAIQPIIQYIMGEMHVVSCVLNCLLIHPYLVFPFFHFAIPCYIFITFYRMLNFFPRINWLYDHLDTLSDRVWSHNQNMAEILIHNYTYCTPLKFFWQINIFFLQHS